MKTLEEIANAAGITKAAIYKRFQSYGLSFNQIKAQKQGRTKVYGEDVERLIILMFQPDGKVDSSVESCENMRDERIEELQGLAAQMEVERNAARMEKEAADARAERAAVRAEDAEARAVRAEEREAKLLEQIDKLTDAIRAAEAVQAAQAAQLARLPEAGGGILKRLKAAFTGGKRDNEQ